MMAVETTTIATGFDAEASLERLEGKVRELRFAVGELFGDYPDAAA
jgi:hypothetical protein